MNSKTLEMILKHLTDEADIEERVTEFPFDVEDFCRENDETIDTLTARCEELEKYKELVEDISDRKCTDNCLKEKLLPCDVCRAKALTHSEKTEEDIP